MSTRLAFALALAALPGCRPRASGGFPNVYIVGNLGCERGCDEIRRGDWLHSVDGRFVASAQALDAIDLADGRPHELRILERMSMDAKTIEIVARPRSDMPPFVAVPPLWTVTAVELDRAPEWARRRMFAHASPIVQLADLDGDLVDGRTLYGRKRLIVYWDRGDRPAEAAAIAFMQVLQKAQADLLDAEVDILFAHVPFPVSSGPQMSVAELGSWRDGWSVREDGKPLPPIPFYRRPAADELDPAREIGMELNYSVMENLGESPAIVILDERGIVRWHSEALATPPADAELQKADQYTIIEAVKFALRDLG